jgi:coatomer subunit beta
VLCNPVFQSSDALCPLQILQVHYDKPVSANEIKEALEGNDAYAKVEAMQKAISMILNGEQLPALFITIVRYVLPSEDHTVQKLLLLYLVRRNRCPPAGSSCPERCLRCGLV